MRSHSNVCRIAWSWNLGGLHYPCLVLLMIGVGSAAWGQARYRTDSGYEDSTRIVIIWNRAGHTFDDGINVGDQMLDFILEALDIENSHIHPENVMIIASVDTALSWNLIRSHWPGSLPHVIVHANAGFHHLTGWQVQPILDSAVQNRIGVVSIGDDAAHFATNTFGFTDVVNVPEPMGGAELIDSLWIGLDRDADDNLKSNAIGLNGIISNAVDSILGGVSVLQFKPYCTSSSLHCRNESDADEYLAAEPWKLTFLGYQRGYDDSAFVADENQFNVIVAFQDTVNYHIRRGVALSYQPQFIENRAASQQIVYDAIMFSSLAHTLSIATRLIIEVANDTMSAGDTIAIDALVIDQKGDTLSADTIFERISWHQITAPEEGDALLTQHGETALFTATRAHRAVQLAAYYDTEGEGSPLGDTAVIYIGPAAPQRLWIESSLTPLMHSPTPFVNNALTLEIGQDSARAYAILRDAFNNFARYASAGQWSALEPMDIVRAQSGAQAFGEGVIIRISDTGATLVRAADNLLADTITVIVLDSIDTTPFPVKRFYAAITRDYDGNGYLDALEIIFSAALRIDPDSATFTITHEDISFTITEISGRHDNYDSVFIIRFEEEKTRDMQTHWRLTFSGQAPEVTPWTNVLARDGAGAVIKRTIFYPGAGQSADTLYVILSEPANCSTLTSNPPSETFAYHAANGIESSALEGADFVGTCESAFTDRVTIIMAEGGYSVMPFADSLQLVGIATDSSGNLSRPPTRVAAIESAGANRVRIVVGPNPFIPGKTDLLESFPPQTLLFYQDVLKNRRNGVLIAINTDKPLRAQRNGTYGRAEIFDAVGNLVYDGLSLLEARQGRDYGIFWRGVNRNNRLVGAGVYLLVLRATDIDNKKFILKTKIGVAL